MNKKLGLAVAGAVMAFGASAANAGIIIPAGDWTLDIGGNVNTFYTYNKCDRNSGIAGQTACFGAGTVDDNQTNITTGLLPNYLSVSGKTRQNDLDVGFTISLQPGSSTNNALIQNQNGNNQENRQAFLTFGDASWGTIKLGKDLGIFGSDAILNDMTLLGVGGGGFLSGNTTTIGGIGTGYLYADWKAQVSYMSPNWNGFSFAAGVMQPWNNLALNADAAIGSRSTPGFEGKVNYEWAGDVSGKIWASFITQKLEDLGAGGILGDETARGFDVGATVKVAGFGLTGYYYDGKGIGTTGFLLGAVDAAGKRRDSDGGYVQATYALPGIGTKLGASYGVSNLDNTGTDGAANFVKKNERWTIGAYHPLTKHLNLVLEYSQLDTESHAAVQDSEQKTLAAGAILFF